MEKRFYGNAGFCFFREFPMRALLLCQIEHESDSFVSVTFEEGTAEQYGHSAAVFPKVLLLEGSEAPTCV